MSQIELRLNLTMQAPSQQQFGLNLSIEIMMH